jgi:hypothetical protein
MICAVGAVVLIAAVAVTLAQVQKKVERDGHTETKVSESREGGKYQRTTQVFRDKVLLSKTQEVSSHDDGKIDVVFTKLFRDGEMIYASSFYKTEKRTIRSYYHQGKMLVEEGDEDGDGFFETMILFDAKEQPVEAFSKNKDGTVAQFSKEKLADLKKSFAKFQE